VQWKSCTACDGIAHWYDRVHPAAKTGATATRPLP
jgi:hypothetical protein